MNNTKIHKFCAFNKYKTKANLTTQASCRHMCDGKCVNSGMDYWNGGIVEWKILSFKFYVQIRHTSL